MHYLWQNLGCRALAWTSLQMCKHVNLANQQGHYLTGSVPVQPLFTRGRDGSEGGGCHPGCSQKGGGLLCAPAELQKGWDAFLEPSHHDAYQDRGRQGLQVCWRAGEHSFPALRSHKHTVGQVEWPILSLGSYLAFLAAMHDVHQRHWYLAISTVANAPDRQAQT